MLPRWWQAHDVEAAMTDVLVRAQALGHWDEGVRAAARVAATLRGALTALHVVPIGMPPVTTYDPGMLAAAAAMEAEHQVREAEAHADAFAAWAASMGARDPVWLASTGDAAQALEYVAGCHDLVVATLDPSDDDPWVHVGGVGRITIATRLPTLVLPAGRDVDAVSGTVAVAWNGRPGAARALHAALPFVQRAKRVVILTGEAERPPTARRAFCIEDWLARHRPDAEVHRLGNIGDGGEPTGAALLDAARREQAGLLVMGAYGHARFSEWVLGGVTRHVLAHADMPLLMRH
jgi:nucleotide-binding universal stress UspA family protein